MDYKPDSISSSKGSRFQKHNVMTPLNWGVGIAETALMSGVILSDDSFVKISCLFIVVVVLLFYGYVYHHFMKKDPDRLQTEDYNIRTQELTLLQDEKDITPPIVTVDTYQAEISTIEDKTS